MKKPSKKKSGSPLAVGSRKPRATSTAGRKPLNGSADWIDRSAVNPDEVRAFCLRNDLYDDGAWAVNLARKNLRPGRPRVVIEGDPEGTSEWLVLEVDIAGSVHEVLQAYTRFKDRLLTRISGLKLALIRVVYSIV